MPLFLNFFFLMVFVCVIAALSIPFVILFLIGLWKKRRWMKWVGGLPAAVILLIAITAFGFVIYGFMHPWSDTTNAKRISATFKSNFGFEPGPDVVPLNQRISGLADYGSMHMQFRASSNTFERIRALGFDPVSPSSFASATDGGAPKWWVTNATANCYGNEKWKGTFASNRAFLHYEPASGQVFFFSMGVD